jgi:hypothetical protein
MCPGGNASCPQNPAAADDLSHRVVRTAFEPVDAALDRVPLPVGRDSERRRPATVAAGPFAAADLVAGSSR